MGELMYAEQMVVAVIANLVIGVKVYLMLRRKKREEWMELRRRDLERSDGRTDGTKVAGN